MSTGTLPTQISFQAAPITFDLTSSDQVALEQAARDMNPIFAVKFLRCRFGLGLAEAKQAFENWLALSPYRRLQR